MKRPELAIMGPYPPPYGGVSVHIQRLLPYLEAKGIEYKIFNQYSYENPKRNIYATNKKISWWMQYLFASPAHVAHFHLINNAQILYVALYSLIKPGCSVLLTIHNESLFELPVLARRFLIFALRCSRIKLVIAVSKRLNFLLAMCKVPSTYLPAYISPKIRDAEFAEDTKKFPKGRQYVFFSIWNIKDKASLHLYGFDFFLRLVASYQDIDFHIFLGTKKNMELITEEIEVRKLANVTVHVGKNLAEYMQFSKIFLRLNRFDAYGVSIKEAIDLGAIAIASDICERPMGSLLYKTDNYDDLSNLFDDVISGRVIPPKNKVTAYHKDLIDIYERYSGPFCG